MVRRKPRWTAAGLAVAVPLLLFTAEASATGVGPFRLGMSLEEIRAAAPQIEWRDVMVSPFTRRVFSIRSDDAVPVAGVEFQVEAMSHYYQHKLLLEGATHAADAMACERAGLDVLAAIEQQAGPFASHAPVTTPARGGGLYWQTQRSANGSITVTPTPAPGSPARTDGETLQFGKGSTVLVETFDDQYRPRPRIKRLGGPPAFLRMQAHHRGDWFEVEAEVNYGKDSGPICAMRLELRRWTRPPLPGTFDTSQAKFNHEPTIAERHFVHARLAGSSAAAVDVELACEVSRQTGWLAGCGIVHPDNLSAEQEMAAFNLARLVAYDMSGVDRDDPQDMRGTVRVRVDPAAVRPTDFLATPRTSLDEIEFTERPDTDTRFVPPVRDEDDWAVKVSLSCRIEADGSLICLDPAGQTEAERQGVLDAARRVAAMGYRVAPKLRNGEPSVGRVIDISVEVLRPMASD